MRRLGIPECQGFVHNVIWQGNANCFCNLFDFPHTGDQHGAAFRDAAINTHGGAGNGSHTPKGTNHHFFFPQFGFNIRGQFGLNTGSTLHDLQEAE